VVTTFYEGDQTGLRELSTPRYTPAMEGRRWGVLDHNQPRPLFLGIRYARFEPAEALADLLNAVEEGEPAHVIEDLRGDLDRARNPRA
jgi:hypothetical protein